MRVAHRGGRNLLPLNTFHPGSMAPPAPSMPKAAPAKLACPGEHVMNSTRIFPGLENIVRPFKFPTGTPKCGGRMNKTCGVRNQPGHHNLRNTGQRSEPKAWPPSSVKARHATVSKCRRTGGLCREAQGHMPLKFFAHVVVAPEADTVTDQVLGNLTIDRDMPWPKIWPDAK